MTSAAPFQHDPEIPGAGDRFSAPNIDIGAIIGALVRWRWIFIGSVLAMVILAVIYTFTATPMYRAQATMEIRQQRVQVIEGSDVENPGLSYDPSFMETQFALLRSSSLAERVARDVRLASNPALGLPDGLTADAREAQAVAYVLGGINISQVGSSRLVSVQFTGDNAQLAADIANSYVRNFIRSDSDRRVETTASARQLLSDRVNSAKSALEQSERALVAYAEEQGIIQVNPINTGTGAGSSADGSLDATTLVATNEALAAATNDRMIAQQRYEQARRSGVSRDALDSSQIQTLRTQLAQLEAEYAQQSQTYLDSYPPQMALRSRIRELQQEIGNSEGRYLRSMRADYDAARAREGELQSRMAMLTGRLTLTRNRSIQYNILQREVDTNRQIYDALLQRFKEIGIAGQIESDFASPIDPAVAPGGPFSPNFLFNLLLALAAGLVLGGGLVFIANLMDDTIKSPDDVKNKLRLPCLGAIPTAESGENFIDSVSDSKSLVAEAYFSARAAIDFATSGGAPRSLVLTSSTPGEGKTSSAYGLARSFAKNGKRVLLIDADMRRPTIVTEGTDSANGGNRGLSVLLTTNNPLSDHVFATKDDGIWAIPCGPIPPSPTELLASGRMRDVIREAEAAFDLVIVDAPPVLGLADAPILGGVCEALVFVVKSAGARRRIVTGSLGRLVPSGTKIIGALLTQVTTHSGGYYYYSGVYQYVYGERGGSKSRAAGRLLPILKG